MLMPCAPLFPGPREVHSTMSLCAQQITSLWMNRWIFVEGRQLQTPKISLSLYAEPSHRQHETSRGLNIVSSRHISLQSNCKIWGLGHSALSLLLPANQLTDSATNSPALCLYPLPLITYSEARGMRDLFKDYIFYMTIAGSSLSSPSTSCAYKPHGSSFVPWNYFKQAPAHQLYPPNVIWTQALFLYLLPPLHSIQLST